MEHHVPLRYLPSDVWVAGYCIVWVITPRNKEASSTAAGSVPPHPGPEAFTEGPSALCCFLPLFSEAVSPELSCAAHSRVTSPVCKQ